MCVKNFGRNHSACRFDHEFRRKDTIIVWRIFEWPEDDLTPCFFSVADSFWRSLQWFISFDFDDISLCFAKKSFAYKPLIYAFDAKDLFDIKYLQGVLCFIKDSWLQAVYQGPCAVILVETQVAMFAVHISKVSQWQNWMKCVLRSYNMDL